MMPLPRSDDNNNSLYFCTGETGEIKSIFQEQNYGSSITMNMTSAEHYDPFATNYLKKVLILL